MIFCKNKKKESTMVQKKTVIVKDGTFVIHVQDGTQLFLTKYDTSNNMETTAPILTSENPIVSINCFIENNHIFIIWCEKREEIQEIKIIKGNLKTADQKKCKHYNKMTFQMVSENE
jgi:ribosomal protein S4E